MTEEKTLDDVAKGEYCRYLTTRPEIFENPNFRPLVDDEYLSWDQLLEIWQSPSLHSLPKDLKSYVGVVFYGKAVAATLQAVSMTGGQSKILSEGIKFLLDMVPGLNLLRECARIGSISIIGMLTAEDCVDILGFYHLIQTLGNRKLIPDKTAAEHAFIDRFHILLSVNCTETTPQALIKQFQALVMWKNLQTASHTTIDLSNIEMISVNVAIAQIPFFENEADRVNLLKLLLQLSLKDEEIVQYIKRLAEKYRVSSTKHQESTRSPFSIEGDCLKPKRPEFDETKEYFIRHKSQVRMDTHPISSNSEYDPSIYVFRAQFEHEGEHYKAVAKQFISADHQKVQSALKNEGNILAFLSDKGPEFLKYYGYFQDVLEDGRYSITLLMEQCEESLMTDITRRRRNQTPYTGEELESYSRSLIDAFALLGQHKIYHYDVKPHNILLTADKQLKICDFNISIQFEGGGFTSSLAGPVQIQGTDGYMAPEIQEAYNRRRMGDKTNSFINCRPGRIDSYGVGLVLLQLAILERVDGINLRENQQLLQTKLDAIKFPWYKNMVTKLLEFDYEKRVSIKSLSKEFQGNPTIIQRY